MIAPRDIASRQRPHTQISDDSSETKVPSGDDYAVTVCCFYKGSHVGDGYAVTACFSNQGSVGYDGARRWRE